MRIKRHSIDEELARERVEEDREDALLVVNQAQSDPRRLSRLQTTARNWAAHAAVKDPDAVQVREAVSLAAQAAGAMFALASQPVGQKRVVRLGEKEVELPTTGADSTTHAGRWLEGMRVAVMVADRSAIDALRAMPTDVVRASSTHGDELVYLQMDLWRALVGNDPRTGELLVATLAATDPAQIKIASPDFVLDQAVPELELIGRLMERDAVAFNAAMEKALKLHREYWGKSSRKNDPEGYIAWGPLALALIARGLGIQLTVESDYLPPALLRS